MAHRDDPGIRQWRRSATIRPGDDPALEIAKAGRLSRFQSVVPDSENFVALKAVRLLGHLDDSELWKLANTGECVGDMSYIKEGGVARQATVEALSEVSLVEFRNDVLDKVSLQCRYQLLLALMHSLVDRPALGMSDWCRPGDKRARRARSSRYRVA